MANSAGEPAEEEDEEEDEEGDAEEISVCSPSAAYGLQAHQESEAEAQGGDVGQGQDEGLRRSSGSGKAMRA